MRACDVCDEEKPDSAFRKFGRGRKKTCEACESGLAASDGSQPAPTPVQPNGHIEIAAGLGFRASIEAGAFEIEQDRVDDDGTVYTHTLTLAPHEARRLIEFVEQHVREEAA